MRGGFLEERVFRIRAMDGEVSLLIKSLFDVDSESDLGGGSRDVEISNGGVSRIGLVLPTSLRVRDLWRIIGITLTV